MEIVNALVRLMRSLGVKVITRHRVAAINHEAEDCEYLLTFSHGDVAKADAVVVTAGGSPQARLVGTKLSAFGSLLITHRGVSGPAILKLSSYAARILAENDYKAQVAINWFEQANEG